jgi:hypothetical protein
MMGRFRCENEERENRYWMEGEERRCRMCNGWSEMREKDGKERGDILNEDGREIRSMKEIWTRRERLEKERGWYRN